MTHKKSQSPKMPKTIELRLAAALTATDPETVQLRHDLLEVCHTLRSVAGAAPCSGFEMHIMACYEADETRKSVMGRGLNFRQHARLYPGDEQV